MTNEKKIELINNINKCLKTGKLSDYTKDEVDAYLSTIVRLKPTPAGLEYYGSVEEICEVYTKKIERLNETNVVDYVVANSSEEEFFEAAENYKFIKLFYDAKKNDLNKFVKTLDDLNEKYKINPNDKKYKDEKNHYKYVIKDVENNLEDLKKDYDRCLKEVEKVGNKSFDKTRKEYQKVIDNAKLYERINKEITGSKINTNTVDQTLNMVKEAYDSYHNNHTFFGRMFRWVSFTSAAKDYNDFCEVRDAFKKCVENVINMKDVDAYLDNKITLDAFNARQAESIANNNKLLYTNNSVNYTAPFKKDNVVESEVVADKDEVVQNKEPLDMSGEVENDKYTEIDEYEYFHLDGKENTNEVEDVEKELESKNEVCFE